MSQKQSDQYNGQEVQRSDYVRGWYEAHHRQFGAHHHAGGLLTG